MSGAEEIRLSWERRPSGTDGAPMAYFNDEFSFAIFPERGSRKWELCWAAPDEGYEILDWFATVEAAKRAAVREVVRERELLQSGSAGREAER